jgi:hypothetical protein
MENESVKIELIEKAKRYFKAASEAWNDQYEKSQSDLRFCSPDCQWPDDVKASRIGRPTYASDRINAQVKAIVNAQRENRPAVTVHVSNDGADQDTAEVLQGMIRHIENESDADLAYDQAFEDAVRCGIGFWRILTKYAPNSFDQEISVEAIPNPFSVYIDPSYKRIDGSDIGWAFITSTLTEDEFKLTYPDAEASGYSGFEWVGLQNKAPGWFSNDGKTCVIAEFFIKEENEKTLVKLSDGRVLAKEDLSPEEKDLIQFERSIKEPVIKWYKINGLEILEETVWPGNRIPVIPVFGDALLVDGKRVYTGLVGNIKEEQMMLNVAKTTAIEMIAQAPKTPWVGPKGFVGDRKEEWANANVSNKAYLEYDNTDDSGNPIDKPERNVAEPPIQGILTLVGTIENDIKATNNLYDPSMGQKISNQSGVAVKALQNAGSVTNYHFSDNLSRAIRLEGRMFLELIPKVYSEKRVIRIIGLDDKHKLVTINGEGSPDETGVESTDGTAKIYDVTKGGYDVVVTAGPSYQTKRQENLAMLLDLAGKDPLLMQVAPDLIVSQFDSPVAIQLTKRLEKTLAPGLLDDSMKDLPPDVVKRLQQDQMMIQQLTEALKKETELANHEQALVTAKIHAAQIQQETELLKLKAQMIHETNTTAFKEELKDMQMKNQAIHDMLINNQKHQLDMEKIIAKAHADMAHTVVDKSYKSEPNLPQMHE